MSAEVQQVVSQRLLDNVTQFKALERGTFALNRQELLIGPWLRQLVGRWQRTATDRALAWVVDIAENLPVLRVDADKVEQALNNILGNAVKHPPAGARVAVKAWSGSGEVCVRISSNPARLIPYDYDHLSELFYTGEVQGRFPTGVGLGLYVTRALIERQGGVLRVTRPTVEDNSVGFELSIPAATDPIGRETRTLSMDDAALANATKGDARRRIR